MSQVQCVWYNFYKTYIYRTINAVNSSQSRLTKKQYKKQRLTKWGEKTYITQRKYKLTKQYENRDLQTYI